MRFCSIAILSLALTTASFAADAPTPKAPPLVPIPVAMDANQSALTQGITKAWNTGDFGALGAMFDPAFINNDPSQSGVSGPEALKTYLTTLRSGFPDLKYEIQEMIPSGDKIIVRGLVTGINSGLWEGMPPTGRSASMPIIEIYQFVHGKIMARWVVSDRLSWYEQAQLPGTPLIRPGQMGMTQPQIPAPGGSTQKNMIATPDTTQKKAMHPKESIPHPKAPKSPTPPKAKSGGDDKKSGSGGAN